MAENNRIADLGWSEAQFEEFLGGFRASYEGRGLPLDDDAKKLRDQISARVQKMLAQEQPNPAEEYFRMLRDKEGVKQTASGLHYRITNEGAGPSPKPDETVVMSFSVRQPDGKDLPELGRERVRVAVHDLLPGLAEGVQLMNVGAKALIYLPASLSFSADAWPAQVPRGMPLAFFVELHEIVGAGGDAMGYGR
jgi:FKBP-type peptidyl-prolyl cis-trans isomerase